MFGWGGMCGRYAVGVDTSIIHGGHAIPLRHRGRGDQKRGEGEAACGQGVA
jgi:hypothetical protein